LVVVLHHHQHIARLDFFLGVEYVPPDSLVEPVGPPVGAGVDDGLLAAVTRVAFLHLFEKFPAVDCPEIRVGHFEQRRFRDARFEHAAYQRGVAKDARIFAVTHHFVQRAVRDRAVRGHEVGVEGRTAVVTYGRQLGVVAYEQDAAARALTDVTEQVVEQRTASERGARIGRGGKHRSLVDDEACVLRAVEVEREARFRVGGTFLPVYLFMYGRGAEARMACHDLRGASGGGEQYRLYLQLFERRHERRDDGRLGRSGITVQDEDALGVGVGKPCGEGFYDFFLSRCWRECKIRVNLRRDMFV